MIYSLPHKKLGMVAMTALIGFFVVSCGSYQQASYYDNDGIYSNGNQRVTEGNYSKSQPQSQQQSNTYGEYFSEKANQYQDVLDSEIFTDVDSYYGGSDQDSIAPASQGNYYASNNDYNGYGGWGDNPTSVNVNIYSGGYGGMGYGYYNPWAWGYGGYWGGYSPWYSPWYGGYYGGYYGGGYWGGGYWGGGLYGSYYPYHSHYPYYGYYGNRQYGYATGRRGYYNNNYLTANSARRSNSTVLNSRTANSRYRPNASSTARRTTDYRSSTTARRSVGVDAAAQNRSYRTSRSTRAVPTYSNSNGNQTISRRSTYSNSNGNTSGRTYRSSAPSSNSRPSSVSPSSNRSSGNTSARSSSSGSYRSSGSSGAVRSSSGSSGGGSRRN